MTGDTSHGDTGTDLSALQDHCIRLVREAGDIALSYFRSDVESWYKSGGHRMDDPVSIADLEIDRFLKSELTNLTPEFGWLSEETEDDPGRLSCKRVWIVDPIDGTRAFLKGRPHFSISVALVEDGRPIIGAVFNPATSEMFTAAKGRGATLNGDPVQVTPRSALENCRMMGYPDLFRDNRWAEPWPTMKIEQRNSAAYRLALVGSGAFDATVSLSPKHDWDIAAADLIVTEALGLFTYHDGAKPKYNREKPVHPSMIGAGPKLHDLILDRVRHMELPQTHGS